MTITQSAFYWILYSFLYTISLLPLTILRLIARLFYVLSYYVFGYRRDVVVQNLSKSFPNKKSTEIRAITKTFYSGFAVRFAEIFKLFSISFNKLQPLVRLDNFQVVEAYIAQGRSVIAAAAHTGNWELMNILPKKTNVKTVFAYMPLKNKAVDKIMLRLRTRFGAHVVPAQQLPRYMLSHKHEPALYILIADQCPALVDEQYTTRFLGQPTSVLPGVERLAKAMDAPVVYLSMLPTGKQGYELQCTLITATPAEEPTATITSKYMGLLEKDIIKHPSSWLWTHKRWKR